MSPSPSPSPSPRSRSRSRSRSGAGGALGVLVLLLVVAPLGCRAKTEVPPAGPSRSALVEPEHWWDALPRKSYASLDKVGVFDDWFEVYRLRDDTYAIYEPYQFQEALSYLVLGRERAALVDCGNGIGRIEKAVAALTDLPVRVLLTHEHPDHFGGCHAFEDVAVFDDPGAVERLAAGVSHDRARRSITGSQVWRPLPIGVDPERFSVPGVKATTRLHDGDLIDLGGRTLEVIATPGHSPGSVSYLDAGNRLLFTGDHYYPGPLYAFGPGVDLEVYLRSNDRLAARVGEYDRVLPGHNETWIPSEVIPRVSAAFRTLLGGGGEYTEDGDLRRYRFDGFDIIVRRDSLTGANPP